MPRQLKVSACFTFVLAGVFYLFFQLVKHQPDLSPVNAFAEDPYDSIGTAGVQLALFTAILSFVRAFRPYQSKKDVGNQKVLLMRGEYITCLSVAVTLGADVVTMMRSPSVWIGLPAGQMLMALIGGMALLTALVGWLLFRLAQTLMLPSVQGGWTRAIALSCVGILILALYPAHWRQSVPGELLTVFVGTALFFVSVWAWAMIISPALGTPFEDVIDDLASVYAWLKAHMGHLVVFHTLFEKMLSLSFFRSMLSWLNPRKHTWNAVLLIGILMGAVLALAETTSGQGGPPPIGQFALIAVVFMGIEGIGVLLGYVLLGKPLGLFRHDSHSKISHKVS